MQFADPKNDLAFKKIFGDENHKEILISFLNSVLDFKDEKEIVDITLTNPYQLPDIKELKETILDIKAKNANSEEFIVEMQKKNLGNFAKRSLYYTAKAYVQQLPSGKGKKDYEKLKKVYYIAIVNFEIFENKNYISRHLIINQETTKQDLKDFEFTFVELPKFNKRLNELISTVDKWIYFIKNANDLTMIPKEFQKEPFKQAFEIATQTVWSQKELEIYEYMALKEYDEENAMKTAIKNAVEKAVKEAKKEAEEIGEKRGMQKGEKQAKIEIAKKSLDMGLDIKTVSNLTGLSVEEIKKLIDLID